MKSTVNCASIYIYIEQEMDKKLRVVPFLIVGHMYIRTYVYCLLLLFFSFFVVKDKFLTEYERKVLDEEAKGVLRKFPNLERAPLGNLHANYFV